MVAIVPTKGLDGKTRLAPAVSSAERRALVAQMLDRVLDACAASTSVTETVVVTPDERVARGDRRLIDQGAGHGSAIASALRDPRVRRGAVVLMADCPLVLAESIDRLVDAARPVALVRAADGGMNALAVRGALAFEPAFGVTDAARATVDRARAAGVEAVVVDDPLLAFDIDRPADLERLRVLTTAA